MSKLKAPKQTTARQESLTIEGYSTEERKCLKNTFSFLARLKERCPRKLDLDPGQLGGMRTDNIAAFERMIDRNFTVE